MSEKLNASDGANLSTVKELKFAYNPSKFMHVLFLLFPSVH